YFEGVNFAYEKSRAEEVAKWGDRVVRQHEQQVDLEDAEKSILDDTIGKLEGIDDVSALEKVAFKDTALRAIHETRGRDPEILSAVLKDLVAATEFVQTKNFARHDSDVKTLEGLFERILGDIPVSSEIKPIGQEQEGKDVPASEKPADQAKPVGGESSHEVKIDRSSNLGVEMPQIHLEFGGQYSQSERGEIQKYVGHTLETLKAMDCQFE
ncbi:MAG: hypothetical protein AAB725_03090, partial [Patescibacteria group bacterium]